MIPRNLDLKLSTTDVTSYAVVTNLRKKEFSGVLEDIKILTSSDQKLDCFEVCNILSAFYHDALPEAQTEEGSNQLLLQLLLPPIQLCIDFALTRFSNYELAKDGFPNYFYHFIRKFLQFELYETVLKYGEVCRQLLEDPRCNVEKKNSYIKNLACTFWKAALQNTLDPGTVLALRELSIEYLLMKKEGTNQTCARMDEAVRDYLQSVDVDESKLQGFMQRIWFRLLSLCDDLEHRALSFRVLLSWCLITLRCRVEFSFMQHFLPWFRDLSRKCTDEEIIVIACCDLSEMCIRFFSLQGTELEAKRDFSNFASFVKEWKQIDTEKVTCTGELVFLCLCAQSGKFWKKSENGGRPNCLQQLPNVQMCCTLISYFVASYEEAVEKNLDLYLARVFFSCDFLNKYLYGILKDEENEAKAKLLLKEAKSFVSLIYSNIMKLPETSAIYKFIIDYAAQVRQLGLVLCQKNLNFESIYFFEMNAKLLLKLKSLPEFNMKETQEAFGLQKLEGSVYAFLKCGKYEEALCFVAHALTIGQDKTKDCFESWRRVKKEAARVGYKGVAQRIISDVLQEMGTDIEPEREIVYLIEEFKLCKSERSSNFEEELLVVYRRLLDLPLSNFDRAYLYLGVLTATSNVSEKLSAILKKPLSEICQEVIDLLTDYTAKHPEDSIGKLHLSIAYFWIYENNRKNIYEIAEKEAQNILKPASPEPNPLTQNDAEEENNTCNIQPVHPLVSFSIENECLKYLNLAVELWEDIPETRWQTMSATVRVENVCDMIRATAQIYSTAVHDLKELKLWILLRSVSTAVNDKTHRLASCSALANLLTRLGYLNMSLCILEEIKDSNCFGSESKIEKLKFELARANYLLHAEKFDDGLDILRAVLESSEIRKLEKSSKMLLVEAALLHSEFQSLPTKAYSKKKNIEFVLDSSPLASVTEAVVTCKSILKLLTEKQPIFANRYGWIHFKHVMVKELLRSHVRLGDLHFKSGDPRHARCNLQDSLKVAESHILTYWASRILLILGQIDLICDNYKDCHVKVSGLKYIFDSSTKPNILEFLIRGQNKSNISSSAVASCPDSPDELAISTVPDITLSRQIKQEFIDRIDVMSSPKQNPKNKFDRLLRYDFDGENFSTSVLKLETFLLFYTSSKTELDSEKAAEIIQVLLNHCRRLESSKRLCDTLKLVNVTFKVEEPFSRLQTRCEILLNHSIQVQEIQLHCIQNDIVNARKTVKKSIEFFERASKQPRYSYPDAYALLKYHDILITLCEFYEVPLSLSLVHYLCPSVKPYVNLKKKRRPEKCENLPNTPANKIPKFVSSKYKSCSKKCRAPLKKNLLNTNLKKDLESENCPPEHKASVIFSSSDECENLPNTPVNKIPKIVASMYKSSRSKKYGAPLKKNLLNTNPKKDLESENIPPGHKPPIIFSSSDEDEEEIFASKTTRSDRKNASKRIGDYKIFTQKNSTVVTDSSDIWNLCLTDTPKLDKENITHRSARTTRSKTSEISKRKILPANSDSQQSRSSRTRKRIKITCSSPVSEKTDELVEDIDRAFSTISVRNASVEKPRSSPKPSRTRRKIQTSYSSPVEELVKDVDYEFSDCQQPNPTQTRREIKTIHSSSVLKKMDELVKGVDNGFSSISEGNASVENSISSSETSKRKIPLANSNSRQPKNSRSRGGIKTSYYSPVPEKTDKLVKDIKSGFSSISEKKASIEKSRSSLLVKSKGSGNSNVDAPNPYFSADLMADDNDASLSPLRNAQKNKVGNLINILCNDLSSFSLGKTKSAHIVADNLDEITSELSELRLLVENSLSYLLYTNICKLLAVLLLAKRSVSCDDERTRRSSFLLSEAFSVSLRSSYVGQMLYYKESEFLKERDLVVKTMKRPYGNMDLQMESFLSVIPDNWSVVQISAFFRQEYPATCNSSPVPTKFLITQYRKNSTPMIVGTDCSSDEKSSTNLLMEFRNIISENELTMLNRNKKLWWPTRSALDIRLKNLMKDVENIWLGCWKGFFLGLPRDAKRIRHLSSAVDAITKMAPCQNEKLLRILIDSAQFLTNEQVCTAVCYLWNCGHTEDIQNKLCKNIRQISTALPNTERHPLILILDQSVQDIPWESMPVARGVPVSRMPSLSLLHLKLRMMLDGTESVEDGLGFDSSRTFYVLNPSGDLVSSQQNFEDQFKRQKSWNGIVGRAPKIEDYVSGYRDNELFIYVGHGSGKKYFGGACVNRLTLRSTSVLMGCSSGKLRRLGRVFEADGIVLKLLLRGCPSVTANLWDVTDGDIDRFTKRFFHYLIPDYDDVTHATYDVAKSVSLARGACTMPHLVGAAPVVYGLPVFAMPKQRL